MLADLERRAERVRAGLLTPAEDRIAEHLATPIGEHVDAYIASLVVAGRVADAPGEHPTAPGTPRRDCGFDRLADLKREALERWLAESRRRGPGRLDPATRTGRLSSRSANWCADPSIGRLASNPFKGVPKADEKADPRRRRRAMTEAELVQLLDVARRRPLLDALTVRRGERKGEAYANVRPEVRERLEAVGRERALIYKTLVLTGLRKSELATLTVAQLRLDGPVPHVELDAADEKNRKATTSSSGPTWRPTSEPGSPTSSPRSRRTPADGASRSRRGLPADTPVFDVPTGLVKILDRDLKAAGIAKRDDRGRHARRSRPADDLRHALEQGRGAAPDGSSRHAAFRPELDRERLHRPALARRAAGPSTPCRAWLSTRGRPPSESEPGQPAPTDDRRAVALPVALTQCNNRTTGTNADKTNNPDLRGAGADGVTVNGLDVRGNVTLTSPVHPFLSVGAAGFEPTTSRPPV